MNTAIRYVTAAVLSVAAFASFASAQAPSVTPEARAIIARHLEARGGADALADLKSMHATGSLSMPAQGITGTVELWAARPDRMRLIAEIEGIGRLDSGFDGTHGWSVDPMMGPALLTGKQLEQTRFEAAFDGPFHDLARYASLTAAGTETFDGRPAHRVNAVTASGDASAEYFDAETGLHAGSISTRETPMGTIDVTSFMRDYRRIGTALQAHQLVQRMMGVEQVITINRVEVDAVADEAFQMPPAVKALIK